MYSIRLGNVHKWRPTIFADIEYLLKSLLEVVNGAVNFELN